MTKEKTIFDKINEYFITIIMVLAESFYKVDFLNGNVIMSVKLFQNHEVIIYMVSEKILLLVCNIQPRTFCDGPTNH